MLKYRGSRSMRARLVMATLSRRAIRIDEIRSMDEDPGVRDFEASLLRLLEKISNGCKVEINETGTSLYYKPGILVGGHVTHDCGTSRSINYYVEALVVLGLFGKKPIRAILKGVTNDNLDMNYDSWKNCAMPLLKKLTGEGDFDVKLIRRGARPLGGGEIHLSVPVVKALLPANMTDEGLVKRVRGIAWSAKVSPTLLSRAIDTCRGVLNNFLPDVYVFTDHRSGMDAGKSPGYGVSLVAETTTDCTISADLITEVEGEGNDKHVNIPEDIGTNVATILLEELRRGGCVDSSFQSLALLLAALGPEESCKVRIGPLTDAGIETLRLIRDFLGVTFNLKPDISSGTVLASCIGSGMKNMARKVT